MTVKALNTIVSSPLKMSELSKILPDVLPLLADFLRKNQRTLRIITLNLLESLVTKFSQGGLESTGLIRVVKEVPSLINEQDLQISFLSLKFITDVINCYPDQISDCLPSLFSSLITLTQSSLLQGATLNAALNLFTALVKSPLPNKPTFEEILDRLSAAAYGSKSQLLHRQAYISIAKSIAVVAHAHSDLNKASKLITKLQALLAADNQSDSVKLFAILTLGELGRIYSSVYSNIKPQIEPEHLIIQSFNCHLEEIKTAASYALGSLAVGNLQKFLPFLLQEINQNPKRQYLLLHALKEVISSESSVGAEVGNTPNHHVFQAGIHQIWQVLVEHCDCTEEGIRNIVAECLGKLCLVDPQRFLPDLLSCAQDPSARIRGTAVTAVRFMIVDHPLPVDEFLRPVIGKFLATVCDPDLQVRRVAIVTLNSAAHNKPKLIRDCLQSLLPALYSETEVKKELVYEVEMGPFKHIVDDGLDLRKAAFECMYTLAEQCIDKIDVFEYMKYCENGLKDQHDIKLLTFLMLIRISCKCALQVSQRIDRFCELIKPQLLLRPKQNAVKQENEKQDELKRSAVRTVLALKRVPNHDRSQKMSDLMEIIRSNPDLALMHEALERDNSTRSMAGKHLNCGHSGKYGHSQRLAGHMFFAAGFSVHCSTLLYYVVPDFMQHTFFLNFVCFPFNDYTNLTMYGVRSTGRNFYLMGDSTTSKEKTASSCSLPKLGVWHILPASISAQFSKNNASHEEMERSLDEGSQSVVIYLHGNSFDRTTKHRCELYNVLSAMDFHVLAIDYRGYGDSSGKPSENGLAEDAHNIYTYARKMAPSKNIFVWGHSMGTGVASRLVAELSDASRQPEALVLESPFNNLPDVIRRHPFSAPMRMLPLFGHYIVDKFVIESLVSSGLVMSSDKHLQRVTCPILVLHAEDDHIIPVDLAKKLVATASEAKRQVKYVEFEAHRQLMHKYIHRARNFLKYSMTSCPAVKCLAGPRIEIEFVFLSKNLLFLFVKCVLVMSQSIRLCLCDFIFQAFSFLYRLSQPCGLEEMII
uniref:Monoacylglycerol lipase ABHD12 n=1 Tax=Ditylenchus dipsaci TaxID=166011 RepID=A0A915D5U2_9BILA